MLGSNKIEINEATMKEAITLWLVDQFKNPPKVDSVKQQPAGSGFILSVSTPAATPVRGALPCPEAE